jgi:hypothetical protein
VKVLHIFIVKPLFALIARNAEVAELQVKQNWQKHLQANPVIVAETTHQEIHQKVNRKQTISSGEIKRPSYPANGNYSRSLCLIKKLDRANIQTCSFAAPRVGSGV